MWTAYNGYGVELDSLYDIHIILNSVVNFEMIQCPSSSLFCLVRMYKNVNIWDNGVYYIIHHMKHPRMQKMACVHNLPLSRSNASSCCVHCSFLPWKHPTHIPLVHTSQPTIMCFVLLCFQVWAERKRTHSVCW